MSFVVLDSRYLVARKAHACDYCGQAIPTGQRYKRWVCVDPKVSANTVRAHVSCDDVATDYYNMIGSDEWWVTFGPIQEWAGYSEDPEEDLADMAERRGWVEGEVARLMGLLGLEEM